MYKALKIPEFEKLTSCESKVFVMFGEKKALEYRSFFRRLLKVKLVQFLALDNLEGLWNFESESTIASHSDFLRKCIDTSFLDPIKIFYFEDIAKIKGLKGLKFTKELFSLKLNNIIILDYFGKKPNKDLQTLVCLGAEPIYIDCNLDYLGTQGHKNVMSTVVKTMCSKNVSRVLQEYLVRKYELDLSRLIQDLFYLEVTLPDFFNIALNQTVFERNIRGQYSVDLKHLLYLIISNNLYKSLELLDIFYFKDDPTYYFITSLNNLLDNILFIFKNQAMSDFNLCRHLWMKTAEVSHYKRNIHNWTPNRIKRGYIGLANLENNYVNSNYSKPYGKALLDQFLMDLLNSPL